MELVGYEDVEARSPSSFSLRVVHEKIFFNGANYANKKEKAFEAFYNDSEMDLRSFFNDIFGDG